MNGQKSPYQQGRYLAESAVTATRRRGLVVIEAFGGWRKATENALPYYRNLRGDEFAQGVADAWEAALAQPEEVLS